MRFKKGDKVEVMNTSEVPISWRTAEIVSGNGHTCIVRYGSGLGMRSENFEERVSRKMIRPCPAVVHCLETWAPGDIVEVHNDYSWKVAIVLSVLPLDRYLVRLLGCSLELSIHKSGMRDRQNWKDGKWIFIRKGCVRAGAKRFNKISPQDCGQKMKSQLLTLDAPTKVLGETDGLATHGKNRGQESCIISSKSLKRMSPYCTSGVDSLYGNAQKFQAIETDNCRRRAALATTLQEKNYYVLYKAWQHMKLRFEDIIDQSHAFSRAKMEARIPCFHMYKDDAGMCVHSSGIKRGTACICFPRNLGKSLV
ncbi:uncharacterized protein LOC132635773 isoform X2 [Lycium barbarum]|uniref:uncharacterized protein LOC132635773 isoform X2 n=1 Tax=Lycium barbarum TaxID=112863 RepID=UPI00293EB00D|nr:uncharacterized protein LOC132635773 isoform X2 [Lycium barbarum]XP_060208280.1 uncharacterized protein LOC132635773 isoform X2 [Lycium barbarum]